MLVFLVISGLAHQYLCDLCVDQFSPSGQLEQAVWILSRSAQKLVKLP